MRYKKSLLIIILAIFLASIAGASAADANDATIASEDTNQMELSSNNAIAEDNLKTSEENAVSAQANDDESVSAQTDSGILAAGEGNYSDLRNEIGNGGDKNLTKSYYYYFNGDGGTIEITESGVINGNGAVIDMDGSNIRAFYVSASGVTIKNLTISFAGGYGEGGAIYFDEQGTVSNCYFYFNTATGDCSKGGAVYFNAKGNVTNCIFNDNQVYGDSGWGGAIYMSSGTVTNCNFMRNKADPECGGAIYMSSGNVSNCNFTSNEAMYGGAVYFTSTGNVTNCNFAGNKVSINGGAILMDSGSVENCNFNDNYALFGGAIRFNGYGNVTNCNFANNSVTDGRSGGMGGAIDFRNSGVVENCNFTDNQAEARGGAVKFTNWGTVLNCNFTDNKVTYGDGGAIYFNQLCGVINCNFTGNEAKFNGGAVGFLSEGTVTNCNFIRNAAFNSDSGAIYSHQDLGGTADTCIFKTDSDSTYQVRILPPTLNVDNFTTVNDSCEKLTLDLKTNSSMPVYNGNISISVYYKNNDSWFGNYSCLSGEGWTVDLPVGFYYAIFSTEYKYFEKINRTITVIPNIPYYANVIPISTNNRTVNITAKSNIPQDIVQGKLLFILPNGTRINATYVAEGIWWAVHEFDDYGEYNVNASYVGLSNVTINNATISIKRDVPINVNDTTVVFGEVANVVVEVPETINGQIIKITVDKTSKNLTVKNGEAKANFTDLPAGEYNITVDYAGDGQNFENSTTAKLTVDKANSTLSIENITLDYGESKNVTVTAEGATGVTAEINNEGVNVINNYTIQISDLNATTYSLTVTTIPDKNHIAVNATVTVTVRKVNSTVKVNGTVLDYGESTDVTVITEGADGFTAKIDDQDISVIDGKVQVSDLKAGNHTLTVTTVPDDNHNQVSQNVTITVNKISSTVNVNDTVLDYGETANVNVTFEGAEGITAKLDGEEIIFSGTSIPIPVLNAGTYNLTVTTVSDENHTKTTKTVTVTVNKINSTLTVDDVILDYGESKNVTVRAEGTTGVTAAIDGVNMTVRGYTIPISGLGAGNYTLTVTTIPDDNHNPVTETAKITVNKARTEITVDSATVDMKALDEVPSGAALTPADAGNLTYKSSNETVVIVKDGKIKALSKGTATITVSFNGNDNYSAAENKTIAVNVSLNDASVNVNNDTLDLFVDDNFTIVATTVPAGLNVTYVPDDSGVVSVDDKGVVTALKEGAASITVIVGDGKVYVENSTTVTVTVSKIPTEIIVQNVTVDMEVSDEIDSGVGLMPSGAGELDFTSSDVSVVTVDGIGTITAVGEGVANVTVRFIGNDKYAACESKNITVTVSLNDASVSVNNSTLDLKVGDNFTIVAVTVPDGLNVTFVPDDSGVYSIDDKGVVTALKEGNATITVKVGDGKVYAENSTAITVTVNKQDANPDVSIPENVTVGDNSTVNVKLPSDATGNVTVKVDGEVVDTVQVTDGSANVTIPSLSAGNHTVEIAYSGDGKYNPSNETKEITVSKKQTTPDITIPSDITVGDDSNIEIKLPSDAGGNVTLKVDGNEVETVPVADGSANLTLPSLSAGNHTLEIDYSGDDKYNPASATKDITVSKKDATPEISVDGSNVDVKLPSDATGNVTVKVDGEVIDTVPVTDGTASVKLPKLSAGNHTVEIAYSGDEKYSPGTKTATVSGDMISTMLTADNVTATYNVKKYLTITLTDSQGSPIANATVSVKLDSAKDYITDANGQIKVKVSNLVPKTYTAKITFKGDDNYTGSNATAKVTVKKATSKITAKAKTFKTTTKTKKYTVTLKSSKGKALKNKTVYLKVKGKTYKAKTNSKGKATFKITKLNKKGTFKATVTFKGNDYYKKATKKVKLTVKSAFKTISKGSKKHATVKKIQRALKNNGYYLSYNGHYLKVDGIYHRYTEMAVKQFQKAKGLKVTGKVDEKTAKKLKII